MICSRDVQLHRAELHTFILNPNLPLHRTRSDANLADSPHSSSLELVSWIGDQDCESDQD